MTIFDQLSGVIAIFLEDPNHFTEYFINTPDCSILFFDVFVFPVRF